MISLKKSGETGGETLEDHPEQLLRWVRRGSGARQDVRERNHHKAGQKYNGGIVLVDVSVSTGQRNGSDGERIAHQSGSALDQILHLNVGDSRRRFQSK
jgi:hypothetical protein